MTQEFNIREVDSVSDIKSIEDLKPLEDQNLNSSHSALEDKDSEESLSTDYDMFLTPIDQQFLEKIKPTQEDMLSFFDCCIMRDEPFKKTYYIGPESKVPVVLRTRRSDEIMQIISELSEAKRLGADVIMYLNDANLAFSLVKVGETEYDEGTLKERMDRIGKMPGPKKHLLWDYVSLFDHTVEKMRKRHLNF